MKPTQALHDLGQSLWVDNITRTMLDDGTLAGYIADYSVTGLTSNPTIFDKAIGGGDAYDEQIAELRGQGLEGEDLFFELALADLRDATDLFAAVHQRTAGLDGFCSLEVSPLIADDAEATIEEASTLGWDRYVGPEGKTIGMHTFGSSAPLKDVQDEFGFTPEKVVEAARNLLDGKEE